MALIGTKSGAALHDYALNYTMNHIVSSQEVIVNCYCVTTVKQ